MAWQPYVFEADLVSTLVLPRAVSNVQPRSIFFAARILSLKLPTSPSGFPYLSLNQTSKFTAPGLILKTTTCKSKTKVHHRRFALAITTTLARGGLNEAHPRSSTTRYRIEVPKWVSVSSARATAVTRTTHFFVPGACFVFHQDAFSAFFCDYGLYFQRNELI